MSETTREQIIHNAAMKVMAEAGVAIHNDRAVEILKDNGIRVENNVAYFTEEQVLEWMGKAPESFTLYARNPKHDVFMGGDVVNAAPTYIAAGAVAPDAFGGALKSVHGWLMANFKWLYILVVIVIVALFLFILFSKYGNVRLGGKDAKPSISKFSWFCLTMTSTIAVGICVWYTVFGGTAMIAILNGTDLYQTIQQFGDGISTFAFLDMLPAEAFFKWFFIILAVLTFLTFSDGVAFSFPMLFMKKTEIDASKTHVPKVLNIAVALFMGALTLVLLYAGGHDALSECMVVVAFPIAIVLLLMCLSVFKFLFHREKHDATYREELEEERAWKQEEFDNRVAAAARDLLGE